MYATMHKIVWKVIISLSLVVLQAGCTSEKREEADAPDRNNSRGSVKSPDGVSIVYEILGSGTDAVVFVHGWSCDKSYWDAQLEPFSQDYRVVAVDLAGHGESGLGRDRWTISSYGADVAAVVNELDLEKVVLVGHSMGGDVVVDAARLLPGRIAGMVWVDTYGQLGSVRTPEQVRAVLAPFRAAFAESTYAFVRRNLFPSTSDKDLAERVARDMAAAPPAIAIASLESSITNDRIVPEALEELNLPVVAINPEDSNTDVESLQRYGVEVLLMPRVGHFMMMEEPTSFNQLLKDVIEGFLQ